MVRLKKIHFITVGLGSFLAFMQSGCFSFRMSEPKQTAALVKKGQVPPVFFSYSFEKHTIHYTHVGDTSKPLVIFLHGSPGSSSAFISYLADTNLTRYFQMISVDRPGSGYSSYGRSMASFAKQSAALQPILERHSAPFKVLVGHSLGGPIIARMAMDAPQKIDGLVILAGSIDPMLEPKEWFRKPLNWIPFRWMIPRSFKVSNQEILPARRDLEEMLHLWSNIQVPVIVLQGTKDSLVPVGNADFAQKMLTNSVKLDVRKLETENHFFIWTKKYLVDAALLDMIEYQNQD